ncbi:hypothetical protein RP20_CCG019767 [Aedes albopictus]|nr:hypothetical protein RP20_CCG019767 [Aedes albopictus]
MSRKHPAKKRSAAALFDEIKKENTNGQQKQFTDSSTQTEQIPATSDTNNVDVKLNKVLVLLAHANAKLDAIGSGSSADCKHECGSVALRNISFSPVKNLLDFEALEENCKRDEFVMENVATIGQIHGRQRYTARGGTVCLQIVDYFFDRQFLMQCSWTGTGRKHAEGDQVPRKIPFSRYERVINLFYQTVLHSDPEFSLDECRAFLHRCLRNAKQRLEELGGTRKPVARKRRQLQELNGQDEEYLDDSEQESAPTEEIWTMTVAVPE